MSNTLQCLFTTDLHFNFQCQLRIKTGLFRNSSKVVTISFYASSSPPTQAILDGRSAMAKLRRNVPDIYVYISHHATSDDKRRVKKKKKHRLLVLDEKPNNEEEPKWIEESLGLYPLSYLDIRDWMQHEARGYLNSDGSANPTALHLRSTAYGQNDKRWHKLLQAVADVQNAQGKKNEEEISQAKKTALRRVEKWILTIKREYLPVQLMTDLYNMEELQEALSA